MRKKIFNPPTRRKSVKVKPAGTTNWLDMSQEHRYGIHIVGTSRSITLRAVEH